MSRTFRPHFFLQSKMRTRDGSDPKKLNSHGDNQKNRPHDHDKQMCRTWSRGNTVAGTTGSTALHWQRQRQAWNTERPQVGISTAHLRVPKVSSNWTSSLLEGPTLRTIPMTLPLLAMRGVMESAQAERGICQQNR